MSGLGTISNKSKIGEQALMTELAVIDSGSGASCYSFRVPRATSVGKYCPSRDDYVGEFRRLVRRWRYSILTTSSTDEIFSNADFKRIVSMGDKAVPLIVREIIERPDCLVAALPIITGADPVPERARGDFLEMARIWAQWYSCRE